MTVPAVRRLLEIALPLPSRSNELRLAWSFWRRTKRQQSRRVFIKAKAIQFVYITIPHKCGCSIMLNAIYLVFDTNISGRFHDAESSIEVTAEDYRLMYNDGGTWRVAFSEDGNWRRFRRHQFAPINTDKIRLEISKAKNGNQARLYEIRVYYED